MTRDVWKTAKKTDQKRRPHGGTNHRGMERCFLGVVARCFWYHAISSRTCLFGRRIRRTKKLLDVHGRRCFLPFFFVLCFFFGREEGVCVLFWKHGMRFLFFCSTSFFWFWLGTKTRWYDEMCISGVILGGIKFDMICMEMCFTMLWSYFYQTWRQRRRVCSFFLACWGGITMKYFFHCNCLLFSDIFKLFVFPTHGIPERTKYHFFMFFQNLHHFFNTVDGFTYTTGRELVSTIMFVKTKLL